MKIVNTREGMLRRRRGEIVREKEGGSRLNARHQKEKRNDFEREWKRVGRKSDVGLLAI